MLVNGECLDAPWQLVNALLMPITADHERGESGWLLCCGKGMVGDTFLTMVTKCNKLLSWRATYNEIEVGF